MNSTSPDEQAELDEVSLFSPEDQLDLLRSNQLATLLATVRFLERNGIAVSDWSRELGETFARSWDADEQWTAEDFLDATIINLAVLGGEVNQAEFAADEATAVVSYLPDFERVEGMDLDAINGDVIYDFITPIAMACGLSWTWHREADEVHVRVATASDAE